MELDAFVNQICLALIGNCIVLWFEAEFKILSGVLDFNLSNGSFSE